MSKYPVSREVLISQRSFGSRVRPFIFIGSPESRQYPSLYLTTSSISLPNWRPPNPPVDNKQQHKSLPNTDWIWKRWQIGLKWFLQSLTWGVMQNSQKIENQIILLASFFHLSLMTQLGCIFILQRLSCVWTLWKDFCNSQKRMKGNYLYWIVGVPLYNFLFVHRCGGKQISFIIVTIEFEMIDKSERKYLPTAFTNISWKLL